MKGVISVIVPVYNVETYLEQAVRSIQDQDYPHLEILLIDDGSQDGSGAICDRLAAGDERIRVIHQKNTGAAAAKNAGLRAATGEYLSVLDSDDYLEPNVYSYMVELMEKENVDVVQCGIRYIYQTRSEDIVLHRGREILDVQTYLKRFPTDWSCALTTNKLQRRKLYQGIFFEEGHRIDDEFFTYQGILNARKILLDDRIIYNYRRRASSAMHAPQARERLMYDRVDFTLERKEKIAARFPQLKREFDLSTLDALIYMTAYPDNTEATLALLKREIRRYCKDRNNTRPPRYQWLPILKTLLTSTPRLLQKCSQPEDQTDLSEYFP